MRQYRILGPLEVVVDGQRVTARSSRQRVLLAMLLLSPNRTVSADLLLRALWADAPPDTAAGQIHTLIWRLRRVLGAAISTEPGGYQLSVGPAELDSQVFTRFVAEAAALARTGQLTQAAQRYTEALDLWRGDLLTDVRLPGAVPVGELTATAAELTELRLVAQRGHIDTMFALGRHAELVPALYRQVAVEPLREDLRERLMIALHRGDRRVEALQVYREGRGALVTALGLEPGASLQQLHLRILAETADSAGLRQPDGSDGATDSDSSAGSGGSAVSGGSDGLVAPETGPTTTGGSPVNQLPADVADWVARPQLAQGLADALVGGQPANTPPIVVISGAAGSGKTTLAVHIAHTVRDSFPDGQLFMNLGGGTDQPVDPAQALARFLRALGDDPKAIPPELDERAALFRTRTSGRRLLVVLDNAGGDAQLRPLLPAEPGCAVLVTSRPRLSVLSGAQHTDVDVFSAAEALDLLRRIIGAARVDAEQADCLQVVEQCGRLPLAIRIAGARLAARPHRPVARFAAQLADEHARLDVLRAGELAVRSSLTLSYRSLAPAEQATLQLLGLLDLADLPGWIAAPLLDTSVAAAEELVEQLAEARLLEPDPSAPGPVRYRRHDLVRAYCRELADELPAAQRQAALARVHGAWLALTDTANDRLPGGFHRVARGDAPRWAGWTGAEVDTIITDPVSWFEAERSNLVAAVRQAAASGYDEVAWDLACAAARFLELREHLDDWLVSHETALRACTAAGNRRGEGHLLRSLGELHLDTDRLDAALDCCNAALPLLDPVRDLPGRAAVLRAVGTAYRLQGRDEEAMTVLGRAEEAFVQLGDAVGHGQALHNIGALHRRAGRLDAAEVTYRQALELFRATADPFGEAYVLCSLGIVVGAQPGGKDAAESLLARSIDLCHRLGYRRGAAIALGHLGDLHLRYGDHDRAGPELTAASAGCREVGDGPGEAVNLRRLGQLQLAVGAFDQAEATLHRCQELCLRHGLDDDHGQVVQLLGRLPAGERALRPR